MSLIPTENIAHNINTSPKKSSNHQYTQLFRSWLKWAAVNDLQTMYFIGILLLQEVKIQATCNYLFIQRIDIPWDPSLSSFLALLSKSSCLIPLNPSVPDTNLISTRTANLSIPKIAEQEGDTRWSEASIKRKLKSCKRRRVCEVVGWGRSEQREFEMHARWKQNKGVRGQRQLASCIPDKGANLRNTDHRLHGNY